MTHSTVYLLNLAAKQAERFFIAETKEFGITLPQYAILAALATSNGLRHTDLVKITGIDRSTMSEVAERLVRRKLITRYTAISDKRAYTVTLSSEGRRIFEAMKPHVQHADKAIGACFGPTHGKIVIFALDLLLRHFPEKKEAK